MTTIVALNALTPAQSDKWFVQTCTAHRWCKLMTSSRPYTSIAHIEKTALKHWQNMQSNDFFEAFEGHPMIGDLSSLRAKFASTKGLANSEQSGAARASEATLKILQQANIDYVNKHGFIFIICATGLSAEVMLIELQKRIGNSTPEEIEKAAQEQLKITLLRIQKALTLKDIQDE